MFGPFYPAPLQEVVNHAERLAELLRTGRLVSAPIDDWAAAWMTGREGEIERFLELTLTGRAHGTVDDAAAAAILAGYLASLHEGMARRLGLHRPACCSGAGEATALPPSGDAITREVPIGSTPADPKSRTLRSVEDLLANLADSWTEPGRGRGNG
jgi:AcrR family transcriptional regulator